MRTLSLLLLVVAVAYALEEAFSSGYNNLVEEASVSEYDNLKEMYGGGMHARPDGLVIQVQQSVNSGGCCGDKKGGDDKDDKDDMDEATTTDATTVPPPSEV
nr:uncharacterized protein LOC113828136 [Penaeus vannamei]